MKAVSTQSQVAKGKDGEEESAYERLLRKVNENKRKATEELEQELNISAKKTKQRSDKETVPPAERVTFSEDDNYVGMEVSQTVERQEFPSPSEDEQEESWI